MAAHQQMDTYQQHEEIYTHKKFKTSTGYAHKKFGTRPLSRIEPITVVEPRPLEDPACTAINAVTKSTNTRSLFRPYALGDDSPRKRKIRSVVAQEPTPQHQNRVVPAPQEHAQFKTPYCVAPAMHRVSASPVSAHQPQSYPIYQQPQQHHQQPALQHGVQSYLPLNKQAFAIMLQKQRAAFYMSNLLRFNAAANAGWPTFVPSAMPTPMGNGC